MEPTIVEPRPSWWSRNWKWFVPVGCLGVFVLICGCCGGIGGTVFYSLHNSWVYSEGVKLAQQDAEVVAELGAPIEASWLAVGSINIANDVGNANLTISLSGSKQKGTLYVDAYKQAGQWHFKSAVVETAGGKKIDLLKNHK